MRMTIQLQSRIGYFIALLIGVITPFAFAPVGFFPLAIVTPAILLLLWLGATPAQALKQGFLFGIGMFGVGVSWVFISIHEFGNTNVPLAALLTLLFIVILAAYPAITGYLLKRYFSLSLKASLFIFPALFVLMEWLRGWAFSGFPWLILGYSQIDSPLAGYIPIIGEFGVSFLILLTSALSVYAIKSAKYIYPTLALILIWGLGFTLTKIEWTAPNNSKWYRVALIQGDIPQELKWSPGYLDKTLKTYLRLTRPQWDKDIIVWPESAIPTAFHYVADFLDALDKEAKEHNTTLITGIPIQEQTKGSFADHFFNSLIVLGHGEGSYAKRHLVPFGEYVPLQALLRGLIGFFDIPMSDFIPGTITQGNLKAGNLAIAPYICYEIAYAEIVRQNLPQAELLVTASNDSWFGNSMAPWQHLEIGRFRAQQAGRYMLFATNSGVSAIIDPKGKIITSIPQFKEAVLTGKVQAMTGATPWVKLGTMPVIILLSLGLVLIKTNKIKCKG